MSNFTFPEQRLADHYEDTLHGEVSLMNPDIFIVRPHCRHLEKYTVRERWSSLNAEDALEVTLHQEGLPAELPREDETAKRFEKVFGHQQSLGMIIRKLVGLDRQAASEAFGEFLHNAAYSATQIRFIDQVISYLTQNGAMDPGLLYEPPFTDLHNEGLDGIFGDDGTTRIIYLLQEIELRAAA